MTPVNFNEANFTYVPPKGVSAEECMPLPVYRGEDGATSCWRPTPDERRAIAQGAPIYLTVFGQGHPPVALQVESPFIPELTEARAKQIEAGAPHCANCKLFQKGLIPNALLAAMRQCHGNQWKPKAGAIQDGILKLT